MTNKDNRRWIKVFPRNFSNEYYFVGFDNKDRKENFMDRVNNEPNSSAYTCRKSKVENVEKFEEVEGYADTKGIYTIYGTDIDIIKVYGINDLNR